MLNFIIRLLTLNVIDLYQINNFFI